VEASRADAADAKDRLAAAEEKAEMAEAAAADASAAASAAAAASGQQGTNAVLALSPFGNLVIPSNLASVADADTPFNSEPAAAEPVAVVVVVVAPIADDDADASSGTRNAFTLEEPNLSPIKASTDDSAELDEQEEAALALDASEGGTDESPGWASAATARGSDPVPSVSVYPITWRAISTRPHPPIPTDV